MKKKNLNQKRYRLKSPQDFPKAEETPRRRHMDLKYMTWLLGMIEGRKISKDEVSTLIKKIETTPPSQKEESG